jgi:hypothetical protein
MSFEGEYGNLPTIEAAKIQIMELEKRMSAEEWAYIRKNEWRLPANDADYSLHQLYYRIMGCQMVIIKNGGLLGFSTIPRIWFPRGHANE